MLFGGVLCICSLLRDEFKGFYISEVPRNQQKQKTKTKTKKKKKKKIVE